MGRWLEKSRNENRVWAPAAELIPVSVPGHGCLNRQSLFLRSTAHATNWISGLRGEVNESKWAEIQFNSLNLRSKSLLLFYIEGGRCIYRGCNENISGIYSSRKIHPISLQFMALQMQTVLSVLQLIFFPSICTVSSCGSFPPSTGISVYLKNVQNSFVASKKALCGNS